MSGVSYTDVSAAFKIFYLPDLIEGFYNSTALMSRMKKTSKGVTGSDAYFAMETAGLHGGVKTLAAETSTGSAFPRGSTPTIINPYVKLKRLAATAEISEEAIQRSKDKQGAWAEQLSWAKNRIQKDFTWDCSRQLHGDGQGKLAFFDGVAGTATSPQGVDDGVYGSRKHYGKPGIHFIHVLAATGFSLDPGNTRRITGGTTSSSLAWDDGAGSTEDLTANALDGDWIIKEGATDVAVGAVAGSATGQAGFREMQGIATHVATAAPLSESADGATLLNYQNVSRAASTGMQGQVKANPAAAGTLRPLTFEVMIDALNAGQAVGSNVTAGYMNYAVERELAKMEAANKRYGDQVTFKGGFRAVMWEGLPFFVDIDCLRNRIYIMDESTFRIFQTEPPAPWDRDGSILRPVYESTNFAPVVQINFYWLANSACVAPFKNVLLTDLEESTTAAISNLV